MNSEIVERGTDHGGREAKGIIHGEGGQACSAKYETMTPNIRERDESEIVIGLGGRMIIEEGGSEDETSGSTKSPMSDEVGDGVHK